jgi:hypothetical protein
MQVMPFTAVSTMPDAGMLLGNSCSDVLNEINAQYANTGIVFGSSMDPLADCYATFKNTHVNLARDTMHLLERAEMIIGNVDDKIVMIGTEEDLVGVPSCMYMPILMADGVREHFKDGNIYGWGVDQDLVGDDDPWDHVLKNGLVETDNDGNWPETYEWKWTSEDPVLDIDERNDMLESRRFVSVYIQKQIDEGTLRDPTDILGGEIGNIIED